jgi:hypothetical protein
MRTAKLTLALLIGLVALAGPVSPAHAARGGSGTSSVPQLSSSNNFWCSGDTCVCLGDADCNDMFDRFDCGADWVNDILGVPVGTCKFPTPRPHEVPGTTSFEAGEEYKYFEAGEEIDEEDPDLNEAPPAEPAEPDGSDGSDNENDNENGIEDSEDAPEVDIVDGERPESPRDPIIERPQAPGGVNVARF